MAILLVLKKQKKKTDFHIEIEELRIRNSQKERNGKISNPSHLDKAI
jgi:hypothetical protein